MLMKTFPFSYFHEMILVIMSELQSATKIYKSEYNLNIMTSNVHVKDIFYFVSHLTGF